MKKNDLTLNCKPSLHFRPLRIIVDIACIFKKCKVYIYHNNKSQLVSGNNFTELAMTYIKDGDSIELQVEGDHEDAVLAVMVELFQNIHLLPYDIPASELKTKEAKDSFAGSHYDGAVFLYQKLLNTIERSDIENQSSISLKIKNILHISEESKECKLKAVLNSKKGMHVLPSTVIPTLQNHFESTLSLLYIDENNEPNSVNAYNMLDLLQSQIYDGCDVTIVSKGSDCKKAAQSLKNILENMQQITEQLEKAKNDKLEIKQKNIISQYFILE